MLSIFHRQRLTTLSLITAALTLAACHSATAPELPPAPELGSGYRTDMSTRHAERHMAAAANPLALA